jgi:hypothetical protein
MCAKRRRVIEARRAVSLFMMVVVFDKDRKFVGEMERLGYENRQKRGMPQPPRQKIAKSERGD